MQEVLDRVQLHEIPTKLQEASWNTNLPPCVIPFVEWRSLDKMRPQRPPIRGKSSIFVESNANGNLIRVLKVM